MSLGLKFHLGLHWQDHGGWAQSWPPQRPASHRLVIALQIALQEKGHLALPVSLFFRELPGWAASPSGWDTLGEEGLGAMSACWVRLALGGREETGHVC